MFCFCITNAFGIWRYWTKSEAKKTRYLLQLLAVCNFEKLDLLEAYNAVNKSDIICLSESYLDFSILSDNDNLIIKGCKIVRNDHTDDVKRGEVCTYIRESLPVRCFYNTYLKECLILEVCINNIKGYVISLYSSLNQIMDDFDLFMLNLGKLFTYLIVICILLW